MRLPLRRALVAGLLAVLPAAALVPAPAQASPENCPGRTLGMGKDFRGDWNQSFSKGSLCASSPNGLYWLTFQTDGNLVLYSARGGTHAVWSSGTAGRGSVLKLQSDGNIVVYHVDPYSARYTALWYTGTRLAVSTSSYRYVVLEPQSDGNLVAYQQQNTSPSRAVWWTGTVGR